MFAFRLAGARKYRPHMTSLQVENPGTVLPPHAHPAPRLRVALILPGLGRVMRGAETAFLELARQLATFPDVDVELFGSGADGPPGVPLRRAPCVPRER